MDADLKRAHDQERNAARLYAPLYDLAYESPFWRSERRAFAGLVAERAKAAGVALGRARVLDVGTGTGSLLLELRALGARDLSGIDLSVEMLERAREKLPEADLRVGPVEEAAYPDASFDIVTGFSVLHHLPDLRMFFTWLERVLRAGGVFAFSDPNARSILLGPGRRVVRGLVHPLHKALRLRNRRYLDTVPKMTEEHYYSEVHRALDREDVVAHLPSGLAAEVWSQGILAPIFNNALVEKRLDQGVLRGLRAVDRFLPLEGEALLTLGRRANR